MIDKEFISAYQGAAEYRINGKRYHCRTSAEDNGQYCKGVYEREILPLVGCVEEFCSDDFPTEEIMAQFPGYVAARYNRDTQSFEFKGTPKVGKRNGVVTAKAWIDQLEAWGL